MTIFKIRGPGADERANRSLAGCVNTKSRSTFYARDGARETLAKIISIRPFTLLTVW